MCSIYAISYTIFILGDWLIYFAPQPINPDWSNVGANYLTMYTYLMAGCTLVITVITSRFARLEAEDSKVSYKNDFIWSSVIFHRFLYHLQSILSMKQMFMRYISHEIRTPLNTLFLGLKLLQDKITVC
jgi:signal transduction histidine kinase